MTDWEVEYHKLKKENARLAKIIELMFRQSVRGHDDISQHFHTFYANANENGTVCDVCECAPCVCAE